MMIYLLQRTTRTKVECESSLRDVFKAHNLYHSGPCYEYKQHIEQGLAVCSVHCGCQAGQVRLTQPLASIRAATRAGARHSRRQCANYQVKYLEIFH
jgi:hypothetical protein